MALLDWMQRFIQFRGVKILDSIKSKKLQMIE